MLTHSARSLWIAIGTLILIMAFSTRAQSAPPQKLHLAGPKFSPYYDVNDQGQPVGELVTLYALIVEQAGFEWEGDIIPARRVMKALADGAYDSSILVKNPLLEESGTILTSPVPVSEMILNLYFQQGRPVAVAKEELLGRKLVLMRGYGYGGLKAWFDEHRDQLVVLEVDSFSSAIRLLETGRADYALLYNVNFTAGEKELGRQAEALESYNLQRVPLYFHLNDKRIPNAQAVMDQLMASYHHLVKTGVLAEASNLPDQVLRSGAKSP